MGVLDPCTNTYFLSGLGNLAIKLKCILFCNEYFPLADLRSTELTEIFLLNGSRFWVQLLLEVSQLFQTVDPILVSWPF